MKKLIKFLAVSLLVLSVSVTKTEAQDSRYSPILEVIKQAVVNPNTSTLTGQINTQFSKQMNTYGLASYTYVVKLSQATADSTLGADTVLVNTTGGTPVYARTSAGLFTISGICLTTEKNKTQITFHNGGGNTNKGIAQVIIASSDKIQITTLNFSGTATDLILKDAWVGN